MFWNVLIHLLTLVIGDVCSNAFLILILTLIILLINASLPVLQTLIIMQIIMFVFTTARILSILQTRTLVNV